MSSLSNSQKDFEVESSDDESYDDMDAQEESNHSEDEEIDINDKMSMEQLLSIQEKIGTKAFSKQITKTGKGNNRPYISRASNDIHYKRANKNRPRELPLQRGPAPRMRFLEREKPIKKPSVSRDPRFDDLSGKLDIFAWKKNYQFVRDKRTKEIHILERSMKKEKNKFKLAEIKDTLQRMKNQEREHDKTNQEREMKKQEREAIISSLKEGKAPRYTSKKEKYLSMKVSQFNKLKDKKKFDKYVVRKEKKLLKQNKF